jgi:hypothetical protein
MNSRNSEGCALSLDDLAGSAHSGSRILLLASLIAVEEAIVNEIIDSGMMRILGHTGRYRAGARSQSDATDTNTQDDRQKRTESEGHVGRGNRAEHGRMSFESLVLSHGVG